MADLGKIEHSHVLIHGNIGSLKLHIARIGKGELGTVVFLHGFPEIWYTWRYQMIAVADAGFQAIAPDFRGYGLSDQPPEPEKATFDELIDDLLSILDALDVPKAFLISKDFGAFPAYTFAVKHPDRVQGLVTLAPRSASRKASLPEGFYINRWREPGRAEADFGRHDAKTVVRNIYILFSKSEIPIAAEGQEIMDLVDPSTPLPPWFTEEDLEAYGALYKNSGFRFPLQIPYRQLRVEQPTTEDPTIKVPALLIMGEKDYVIKFPGMEQYVRGETQKKFIPNLELKFLPEGSHFVHEQNPEEVNGIILDFLKRNV
ncbi:LOW QUALITY PROTEIN: uncharacterized protein LOC110032983 [Phalaenopsis equestris]|uniref:LOW QUALITY PROTEIN: uncharacterized protein LOC110032983 n=1 Tax=Phalaenopsis equestris TaxID=78828 RepID=UPI0009E409DF|nr:LOW QUALITY PROTEIN: uncharacterized protein LOC110032983 [Phalaenopsis equestris]